MLLRDFDIFSSIDFVFNKPEGNFSEIRKQSIEIYRHVANISTKFECYEKHWIEEFH